MTSGQIDRPGRSYRGLIGTGGIGGGTFFALNGNHTLGREESRSGRFLDRRDYCKLHIICHYVRKLTGPDFRVLPIGKVGKDELGRQLSAEMQEIDLDLRYISAAEAETSYCICLVYPDGSGGNLTVDDSAGALVDEDFIRQAEDDFAALGGEGIALAAPEVPLEARAELLRLAGKHGLLRAAAVTSQEIRPARDCGMLDMVDLLALNIDEAATVAAMSADLEPATLAEKAVGVLRQIQPNMLVSMTAGRHGSWLWDGRALTHQSAHDVELVSTAGAGDAHFAGILAGLAGGLPLPAAHELGGLVAAMSVTSGHTINKQIDRQSVGEFARRLPVPLSADLDKWLR